jgi:hypothetical protein
MHSSLPHGLAAAISWSVVPSFLCVKLTPSSAGAEGPVRKSPRRKADLCRPSADRADRLGPPRGGRRSTRRVDPAGRADPVPHRPSVECNPNPRED